MANKVTRSKGRSNSKVERSKLGVAVGILILLLSPFPADADPLCGFGDELLPLMPDQGWPNGYQGFVRIVSDFDSSRPQVVEFNATDDAGNTHAAKVEVGGLETLHFNSDDLVWGDPDKGGLVGIGEVAERGHWRLCFTNASLVDVTGYVRTRDGFLTGMTASVRAGLWRCGEDYCPEWIVPIFNPATNPNQASTLRLINNSTDVVEADIFGRTSEGSYNMNVDGEVMKATVALPSGQVIDLRAAELEVGTDDETSLWDGLIGPSSGKWRLEIRARSIESEELVVLNLLSTPTGHLTNLSADSSDAWIRR